MLTGVSFITRHLTLLAFPFGTILFPVFFFFVGSFVFRLHISLCLFFCESFSTRLPPSSSDSTCFSTIDKCHCRHKRDIKQCCAGQNKCITIVGAQRSYSMTLEYEVFNLVVTRCGAVINSNLNSGMVACATRCNSPEIRYKAKRSACGWPKF